MTYMRDADKKTRAAMSLLVETSKDCCEGGHCHRCLMQLVGGECGSIKLRGFLGEMEFVRDENGNAGRR